MTNLHFHLLNNNYKTLQGVRLVQCTLLLFIERQKALKTIGSRTW